MSELSQIIWDFFQFKKIWIHLFILYVIQIQYVDNALDKKNNHNILNIDLNTRYMSELSVMMRWACKKNAEQNENLN